MAAFSTNAGRQSFFPRHEEETVPGSDRVASEPVSSFLRSNQCKLPSLVPIKELHLYREHTDLWSPPFLYLRLYLGEDNEANRMEDLDYGICDLISEITDNMSPF